MIRIIVTASIIKRGKGSYVAHANEFPITAEYASTQRGAIRNLKAAVFLSLQSAMKRGALTDYLKDAGYSVWLTGFDRLTLEAHPYNTASVSLPTPYSFPWRSKKRPKKVLLPKDNE
jgi:hypothetical protein